MGKKDGWKEEAETKMNERKRRKNGKRWKGERRRMKEGKMEREEEKKKKKQKR